MHFTEAPNFVVDVQAKPDVESRTLTDGEHIFSEPRYAHFIFQLSAEVSHATHSNRIAFLWEEGNAYLRLWQVRGTQAASESAVRAFRSALSANCMDLKKNALLHSLAFALRIHGNHVGDVGLLTEAECIHRTEIEEVQGCIQNHSCDLGTSEISLGNSYSALAGVLYSKYCITGNTTELDDAIAMNQMAMEIQAGTAEPATPVTVMNMSSCLLLRYQAENDVASLYESLRLFRGVGEVCTAHTIHLLQNYEFLGCSIFQNLYTCHRRVEDIDASIALGERGFISFPPEHPDRWVVADLLAFSYHSKTRAVDDRQIAQRARDLRVAAHLHGCDSSRRFAVPFAYGVMGEGQSLTCPLLRLREVVDLYKEVLDATPPTHFAYTYILVDYACNLGVLFDRCGESDHLDEALQLCVMQMEQLGSRGESTTHFLEIALDLEKLRGAICFLRLCQYAGFSRKLDVGLALAHLSDLILDTQVTPRVRVYDATALLKRVDKVLAACPGVKPIDFCVQLVDVYERAIDLLPLLSAFNLEHDLQLIELAEAENLGTQGAFYALLNGSPEQALKLLEQARCVFWAQAFRVRDQSLLELPSPIREDLLKALTKLRQADSRDATGPRGVLFKSANVDRARQAEQVERLIAEARALPGMKDLFHGPTMEDLMLLAVGGPVVTLIAAEHGAYAVILQGSETSPQSIQLPQVSWQTLREWAQHLGETHFGRGQCRQPEELEQTLHSANSAHKSSRAMKIMKIAPNKESITIVVLQEMWEWVVLPVVLALGLQPNTGKRRPRLFWCPTGGFTSLPLHAAGSHAGSGGVCCSDYFVSSYTPTLAALTQGRHSHLSLPREDLRALIVAQPDAPTFTTLLDVQTEVEAVRQVLEFACGPQSTVIPSSKHCGEQNQRHEVLHQITHANVLHLVCHGVQDMASPLRSGFALQDGLLTIQDLIKLDFGGSSNFLAFLSACETAKGDRDQPDQILHLAAAMLYSGFDNVIASMWTMEDADGPILAGRFYEELLEDKVLTSSSVAYALDAAVTYLRESGSPPWRWATFVHLGS